MKLIKKMLLPICLLVLAINIITGCNTVQGAGEDIQSGGKAITRAAS